MSLPWFRHSIMLTAAVLGGLTCSFPTDKSDQVIVLIESTSAIVIRGQQMPLVARAYRVSDPDTVEIQNASFVWTSRDLSLATVQPAGGSVADVTGVNSGTVQIEARAVAYERAELGQLQLRVANPLEVDSVRPSTVRWGDTLTVYGVGVDSIFLASLENATLLDYPIPLLLPTRTRDEQGFGSATFWVPPPARAGQLSYIGPGVFGQAPDSTMVDPVDALEPNETAPREIDLDVSPPRFPLVPTLLFYNPALAFEAIPRDATGIDWYRFSQTTTRDVTLILGGPMVRGTFDTFLTDSLVFTGTDYQIGPASWTIGPESNACAGFVFAPEQLRPDSTIVALRDFAAGVLHSISAYRQPGPYSIRVQEGYLVADPLRAPRDDHEEDDFCTAPGAQSSVTTVSAGSSPWRDTLTIDNPHDVDWIRFRVSAGPLGQATTFKIASLAAGVDSSDIDLYVLTVPGGGASAVLTEVRRSVNAGSSESFTVQLSQGDHYAVVVDFVGRPVTYAICIQPAGILPACNPFPSAPASPRPPRRSEAAAPPVRVREAHRE